MNITNEEIEHIDNILFIEREKIWMDAYIQLNLADFVMVKRLYELEKDGVRLKQFAKIKCGKKCKHTRWVQCLIKYLFCSGSESVF
jgi:hypothetical protein